MDSLIAFIIKYSDPTLNFLRFILGTFLAALFALWFFFRQKEYELVRRRYLEDGLDVLVRQIESALHVYQHNWTRCFLILKTFRDFGKDTPRNLYEQGFLNLDMASLQPTRHYLLQQLIHTNIFYDVHQSMIVFLQDANNFFINDLCAGIRISIDGGKELEITASRQQMIESLQSHLMELNEKANKFWIMLGNLQHLSFELEKQRFTFRKLKRFQKNKIVKKSVETVTITFDEHLKKIRQAELSPNNSLEKDAR